MSTRPTVVAIVRNCAFQGLASQRLPDDVTALEEAEGLICHAMHRLAQESDGEAAFDAALGIVHKFRNR